MSRTNGLLETPKATKAEHDDLRALCVREFASLKKQLAFITEQVKMTGVAVEEILKALDNDDG